MLSVAILIRRITLSLVGGFLLEILQGLFHSSIRSLDIGIAPCSGHRGDGSRNMIRRWMILRRPGLGVSRGSLGRA